MSLTISASSYARRRRVGKRPPMSVMVISALLVFAIMHAEPSAAQDWPAAGRARMVAEIAAMARATAGETGRPSFNAAVMAAIGKVPRHRFVPVRLERYAYDDRALPIGEGQTISQPFLVALRS